MYSRTEVAGGPAACPHGTQGVRFPPSDHDRWHGETYMKHAHGFTVGKLVLKKTTLRKRSDSPFPLFIKHPFSDPFRHPFSDTFRHPFCPPRHPSDPFRHPLQPSPSLAGVRDVPMTLRPPRASTVPSTSPRRRPSSTALRTPSSTPLRLLRRLQLQRLRRLHARLCARLHLAPRLIRR